MPATNDCGPAFSGRGRRALAKRRHILTTDGPVVIYPTSDTGAWEAALPNTLSPGDAVLMRRTAWFATLRDATVKRVGLEPAFIHAA